MACATRRSRTTGHPLCASAVRAEGHRPVDRRLPHVETSCRAGGGRTLRAVRPDADRRAGGPGAGSRWLPAIMEACERPFRNPLERVSEPEIMRTWPPTWSSSWTIPIRWPHWEQALSKMRRATTGPVSLNAARRSTPDYEHTKLPANKHRHAVLQRRAHHRRLHPVAAVADLSELGIAALRRWFHGCQPRVGVRIRRSAHRGVGRPAAPPIGSALERMHRPRPRRVYCAHGCGRYCLPLAPGKTITLPG